MGESFVRHPFVGGIPLHTSSDMNPKELGKVLSLSNHVTLPANTCKQRLKRSVNGNLFITFRSFRTQWESALRKQCKEAVAVANHFLTS